MEDKQFSITGIRILSNCSYRKVINPGYYAFNEWYEEKVGKISSRAEFDFDKSFFREKYLGTGDSREKRSWEKCHLGINESNDK